MHDSSIIDKYANKTIFNSSLYKRNKSLALDQTFQSLKPLNELSVDEDQISPSSHNNSVLENKNIQAREEEVSGLGDATNDFI